MPTVLPIIGNTNLIFGPAGTDKETIIKRQKIFQEIVPKNVFPYESTTSKFKFYYRDASYISCFFDNNNLKIPNDASIIVDDGKSTTSLERLKTGMRILIDKKECIFIEFIFMVDTVRCQYYDKESETIGECIFTEKPIITSFYYEIGVLVLYETKSKKKRPGIVMKYNETKNNIYSLKDKKILSISVLDCFFEFIKYGISLRCSKGGFFGASTECIFQKFDYTTFTCIFNNGYIKSLEEIIIDDNYSRCPANRNVVIYDASETTWKNTTCNKLCKTDVPIIFSKKLDFCRVKCYELKGQFIYNNGTPFLHLTNDTIVLDTFIDNIEFTTELIYGDAPTYDVKNARVYNEQQIADKYLENLTLTLIDKITLDETKREIIYKLEGEKSILKKIMEVDKEMIKKNLSYAKDVYDEIVKIKKIDESKLSATDKLLFDAVNLKLDADDLKIQTLLNDDQVEKINNLLKSETFLPLL